MTCSGCVYSKLIVDHYDLLHRRLFLCSVTGETMKEDDECIVESPVHYVPEEGVECIDYLKQVLTPEEFLGYCKGNTIKYLHRCNLKGTPETDRKKAANYALMAAG